MLSLIFFTIEFFTLDVTLSVEKYCDLVVNTRKLSMVKNVFNTKAIYEDVKCLDYIYNLA